jgi:hypothetical protein
VFVRLGIPPKHAGMVMFGNESADPTSILVDGQM